MKNFLFRSIIKKAAVPQNPAFKKSLKQKLVAEATELYAKEMPKPWWQSSMVRLSFAGVAVAVLVVHFAIPYDWFASDAVNYAQFIQQAKASYGTQSESEVHHIKSVTSHTDLTTNTQEIQWTNETWTDYNGTQRVTTHHEKGFYDDTPLRDEEPGRTYNDGINLEEMLANSTTIITEDAFGNQLFYEPYEIIGTEVREIDGQMVEIPVYNKNGTITTRFHGKDEDYEAVLEDLVCINTEEKEQFIAEAKVYMTPDDYSFDGENGATGNRLLPQNTLFSTYSVLSYQLDRALRGQLSAIELIDLIDSLSAQPKMARETVTKNGQTYHVFSMNASDFSMVEVSSALPENPWAHQDTVIKMYFNADTYALVKTESVELYDGIETQVYSTVFTVDEYVDAETLPANFFTPDDAWLLTSVYDLFEQDITGTFKAGCYKNFTKLDETESDAIMEQFFEKNPDQREWWENPWTPWEGHYFYLPESAV